MESGFDDFISKPIDIRQLNMTLNKLIRDRYPADVVEAAKKQKDHLYSGDEQKKSLGPELAEIFIRDAKKAIAVMEAIYLNNFRRDDDLSIFVINIHAMKSALANIEETNLSADAAALEKAGREKNINLILSKIPSFLEMLRAIIKKLEPKKDDDKKANIDGDNQYLREKLTAVKDACALYDKKTANDLLAEIRKEPWPQSVDEQLSAMSVHLLHSEFEEVTQIVDNCLTDVNN
jgi:HPt (histidine-containing phosphotransfer) domain-containing protein